jgi:hypothetical protein
MATAGPYSQIDPARRGTRFPGSGYEQLINQGRYGLFRGQEELQARYPQARAAVGEALLGPRGAGGVRPGRPAMGGKTGAVLGSFESLVSGDPLGAVISAPVGLGAGQLANIATTQLTKRMMGTGPLPVRLAGAGLRFLVPGLVGYGAQQATAQGVQAVTGAGRQAVDAAGNVVQGTASAMQAGGLDGLGGGALSDLTLFGQPIGTRARAAKQAEFEREQRRKEAGLETELRQQRTKEDIDFARAQGQIATQTYLDQMRGMAPLIEQQDRRRFTQQQALLNTQGSIYQSLGRQAGAIQLAGIGMQESGALARTMVASNPYAGAVIQAPQITFGR